MKKLYSLITLLVLVLLLAACGGSSDSKVTTSDLSKYLKDTVSEYKQAESVAFSVILESEDENVITKVQYNTSTSEYYIEMTDELGKVVTIVKDGKSYFDRYGTKTVVDIDATAANELVSEYSFETLTKSVLSVLSNSVINASTITESNKTSAKLECDVFSLVSDPELDAEDQLLQDEIFISLQMLTSFKLEVEFESSNITKLVGILEHGDGSISKLGIEFTSTANQTITVSNPSDYEAQ